MISRILVSYMTKSEEVKLVELARSDSFAFAKLYEHYYSPILNYLMRRCGDLHIAQDLTSETFMLALRSIKQFRWQPGIGFSAWLYKIATNCLNMFYRKQNKYRFLPPAEIDLFMPDQISEEEIAHVEAEWDKAQEFREVQKAILKLDSKYQAIIQLRFFEEKSYEEIAFITGIKIGTLKSHLSRALSQLRQYMDATKSPDNALIK